MKKYYGIDMEKTQKSKLLTDIPKVDIVITMGCNVNCPFSFHVNLEKIGGWMILLETRQRIYKNN